MVATRGQVSSDYFRTLGVPLVAGREFTRADVTGRQKVAIVNEAFVRKFNLGADVLGRRMARGAGTKKELDIEIVGLVRDSAHSEVRDRAKPQVFFPYRQEPPTSVTFYARTSGDVRRSWRRVSHSSAGPMPICRSRAYGPWTSRFGRT